MLNLFRNNTLLAWTLLLILVIVLRIPVYLKPIAYEYNQTAPFANFIFTFIQTIPNHYLWSLIISASIVFVQAILLNYIVTTHEILYKDSFLPALFFVLLNSLFPQQTELFPQLISTLFLLLLFQRLCYLYESANPQLVVLDAGLYLGIGILFNYDLFLYLPFILISVVIFTSFNFRYLLISVLGIILPLYFIGTYFYVFNRLDEIITLIIHSFETKNLITIETDWERLLPWVILAPVSALSILGLQQNFFRNKVKSRRIVQTLFLMLFFGILGLFFDNINYIYALCYLSIPLSIILAYYFISTKNYILKELIFIALLMLIFYYQLR
ncbi:MAG: hypothetical protein IT246_06385 [Bacteroidia bacterium]|nr:hypothetical protein [Bacteroidia bacterium]